MPVSRNHRCICLDICRKVPPQRHFALHHIHPQNRIHAVVTAVARDLFDVDKPKDRG